MKLFRKGYQPRHRRYRSHRKGATIVTMSLGLAALSGCSVSMPIDQASVIYHDGTGDKSFDKCIPAGKRLSVPVNNQEFDYPVNGRDFQFAANTPGAERTPIQVLSKDGIKLDVSGAVYFTLNDKCDVLRIFHEQVGTNYKPGVDGLADWNAMLAKYIGVPVENALDRVSLNYKATELTGDPTKKNQWQAAAQKQITDSINQVTGGQPFFCKPGFKGDSNGDQCGEFSISLGAATLPSEITDANAAATAQAIRNSTATNAAEAQKTLIAIYGVQGYIQLQQIELLRQALAKGNVPFLPVPSGGSLVVPAK